MKIENQVIQILDQCHVVDKHLYLPNIILDRKLYVKVNKVLALMGGKWHKGKKAHIFSIDNAADLLNQCIETGEITDIYKELQFFETPKGVVDLMLDYADLQPEDSILEPSAGKGAIALEILKRGHKVQACEIHKPFVSELSEKMFGLYCIDFLEFYPDDFSAVRFNKVVANPPFTRQQDIDHATHAFNLLPKGGKIVCIMSASVTFRQNKKTLEFISLLDNCTSDYEFITLPEGSFKKSGTMVNTVLLVADKS